MSFIVIVPGRSVQASEAPCIPADAFDGLGAMAARRTADKSSLEDQKKPPSQEEEARYYSSHFKPTDVEC